MSQQHAHAWWAEVEEVRERIERRREAGAPRALHAVPDAGPAPRRTVRITGRAAAAPAPRPLVEASARRRDSRPAHAGGRPDRIAAWAVLLGIVLLLVAAGTSHAATSLGERTLKVPMQGRDVRHLQLALRRAGLLRAPATARFGPLTRRAVRRFQRTRCLEVDGIAGPTTIAAIRRGARSRRCATRRTAPAAGRNRLVRVATWYGPGLYGRRTACGQKLTARLIGVAHRTLPCGTPVHLSYAGRRVTARVVDRGPYAAGVHYDLTWAAAKRLGMISAGRVTLRADH